MFIAVQHNSLFEDTVGCRKPMSGEGQVGGPYTVRSHLWGMWVPVQ